MLSSISENDEPPDKVNDNENDEIFVEKNSRPRSEDDDLNDHVNPDKKVKIVNNWQDDIAKTLCRNSLLDTNPFAILDTDETTDDLAGKVSSNINVQQFRKTSTSGKNKTKLRIPPITITKDFKNPKVAISNIQDMLKGKVNFKILKEGYIVTLESLDDHSSMKDFLAKQKLPFYTYTTSDKKPLRLVVKGVHHSYTPEEITDDLATKNVNVLSVQPMFAKGKAKMDMFIVNFEQGTNTTELTKKIKYICNQCVSWHKFIKKDVGTQCRKCQRFGHAASNCGLEYRCVKCPHRHAPGDCPLEDDQPATCVNCNNDHPASYKKCPVYLKYADKLKKSPGKPGNNQTTVKVSNPTAHSSKNSLVRSNVSYSQALKTNAGAGEKETNLNFLSDEINKLFDCPLTELMHKIKSFIPEYKKVNDMISKKIMIIDFLSQFA